MMELTDGTINIKGMEYRPIPALNVNLSPGLKVMTVLISVARVC
jgi:RecQ mediated genome instability protein